MTNPKPSHPWKRAYKVNLTQEKEDLEKSREPEKAVKPLSLFLSELVESWQTIEIYTSYFGRDDYFKLKELPQSKQAAWLAGILKRNYA